MHRHLSKETSWLPGELEANLALGIVYEELGDVSTAIACHERRLELATESEAVVRAMRVHITESSSVCVLSSGMGIVYEELGDVSTAIACHAMRATSVYLRQADKQSVPELDKRVPAPS